MQIIPGVKTEPIEFSAPLRRIYFDILGANSWPTPHTKKSISWLTLRQLQTEITSLCSRFERSGHEYRSDVGDNTPRPDGQFARTATSVEKMGR